MMIFMYVSINFINKQPVCDLASKKDQVETKYTQSLNGKYLDFLKVHLCSVKFKTIPIKFCINGTHFILIVYMNQKLQQNKFKNQSFSLACMVTLMMLGLIEVLKYINSLPPFSLHISVWRLHPTGNCLLWQSLQTLEDY